MLCVMSMCPCVCSVVSGPLSFCLFPLLLARSCNCCMLFAFAFVRIILHVISFWLIPPLFLFLVPKLSWWPLGSKPGFLLNEFSKKWSMIAMITTWRPGLMTAGPQVHILRQMRRRQPRYSPFKTLDVLVQPAPLLIQLDFLICRSHVVFFKTCSVFIYDQHLVKQTVTLKVSQWPTYIQYL